MPKKPYDPSSVVKKMLGAGTAAREESAAATDTDQGISAEITESINSYAANLDAGGSEHQEEKEDERKKPAGFYLTDRLFKAIQLRIMYSKSAQDKDKSAVVRSALESYLAEELKQIK